MKKTIFLLISLLSLARAQDSLFFSCLNQPFAQMVSQFSQADSFRISADNKEITFQMEGGKMTFRFVEGFAFEVKYSKEYSVKSDCDTVYNNIMDYFLRHNFIPIDFYEDGKSKKVIAYSRSGLGCRLAIKKEDNKFTLNYILQNINTTPYNHLLNWPTEFLEESDE